MLALCIASAVVRIHVMEYHTEDREETDASEPLPWETPKELPLISASTPPISVAPDKPVMLDVNVPINRPSKSPAPIK